ncbi:hypothetical protein FHL15_006375 [Xylaria flabelliformis]|uniref:DUF7918 domain-containing protein n=1 Tax=Xylaria flabelliformis TaxID=2512241 RepID=A0A553HXM3_9PEZI|nr:hypothetical protein FHL15_006375 [Xylaria flabelliformis]
MAIHDDVPGLEVTVRCNEEPLHELEDPNAHDSNDAATYPSITKYIECVDDAEFDVTIEVSSDYQWGYRNHVLVAYIYVDGKYIRGVIISSQDTCYGRPFNYCVKGPEFPSSTDSWVLRKFKFTAVKTVDDTQKERVERDMKVAKDLGLIEIKFYRKILCGSITYNGASHTKSGALELAEKSIKGGGISHGTSYGRRETIKKPKAYDVSSIAEDAGPILIMKFLYRSRDALKRELIIPRSPSPTFENLTPAERDRLARERLDELREMKIKRENLNPTIKREFGETIDLTEVAPELPSMKKTRLKDGRQVDLIDLTEN